MANYELLISELKSGRFMQTVVARRVKKSGGVHGYHVLEQTRPVKQVAREGETESGREYSRVFGS
ncbi:unnamed protein product [Brassica oleracea var. botrytis]